MFISRVGEMVVEGVAPGNPVSTPATPPPFHVSRLFDVLGVLVLLVFTAPLMLAVALLVKLQDGGPIFYGQQRLGYGGRTFKCWKFRSMVVNAELKLAMVLASDPAARQEWDDDHKLRNDPRITALGRFLRKSSLDELPQFFNILVGQMSLVGPRPIVVAEATRYGRWFKIYCSTRPGLTGLWQVSGRNNVDYRRRVALDVMFARRRSLRLYFGVLLATVPSVLKRDGSY
jgi:exopolysaccharide production protein ExoY